MRPGSTKAYAAIGFTGVLGMLGAMAFEHLGDGKGPTPNDLTEELHVDLGEFNLGQLAFSDRRLFLLAPRPDGTEIVATPLTGTTVSYNDQGMLNTRRRTYLVVAADGRWFVGEAQAGIRLRGHT